MTDSERQAALTEARQIYVAAPIILPMLERLGTNTYQKLISSYRNGDSSQHLSLIAELSVIEAMKRELKSKMDILNEEAKK